MVSRLEDICQRIDKVCLKGYTPTLLVRCAADDRFSFVLTADDLSQVAALSDRLCEQEIDRRMKARIRAKVEDKDDGRNDQDPAACQE